MNDVETALRTAADELQEAPGLDIAARAASEGLVDVAYTIADSPVGSLVLAATPRGLVRVSYIVPWGLDSVLEDLSARVSPRVLEAPARLDDVRRELDEYFAGERTRFDLDLDWSLTAGFVRRVLQETARIGYGELRTYKEMAAGAGSPRAVRAAGSALGANPLPVVVPCHRVVRTGGGLGGYTGGLDRKELLLRLEGALL